MKDVQPVASGENPGAENPNEIKLSDGRIAVVRAGKGKDARHALRIAGDESDKYMIALMSLLVTIDGKQILAEDFDEMPLPDYMKIQTKISQENFM